MLSNRNSCFLNRKANCLKSLGLHEMQDLCDTKKCFDVETLFVPQFISLVYM